MAKAKVVIHKSFDESKEFTKEWKNGDFKDFFKSEGEYLDRLSETLKEKGETGDMFSIAYIVTVEK